MISKHAVVDTSYISEGVDIWHFTHVRGGAKIGRNTNIGSHCYIDEDVEIGSNCKIQSGCLVYKYAKIGDGVFLGPRCLIINDKHPRAADKNLKKTLDSDWMCDSVTIEDGASIGAGAIIMPGIKVGRFAMIGAGAVVTKDVDDFNSVVGIPARVIE